MPTIANWMVHLRDGGERIGLTRVSMHYNADSDSYEFFTESGELDSAFPTERIKYVQRKFNASERQ